MEIHKPKAAHSLGEFAREMAAVILGILIALALEQSVEAYHWGQRVEEGRKDLASEIRDQSRFYAYRVAVHPCVVRRLAELDAVLADLDAGRKVAPVAHFDRPRGFLNYANVWQALGAAGVLAHFNSKELVSYSQMYAAGGEISDWTTQQGQDWAAIQLLEGDPNRLTPSARSTAQVAINHARTLEDVWARNSQDQLARARDFGVAAPPPRDVSHDPECVPLTRG
jgi:hypothetical protein